MENYFSEYRDKGKILRYHAFDKIENSRDAYLIGYLSSDGTFSHSKDKYFRMGVCSTDTYLVESFNRDYCPDHKVSYREPRSSKKVRAINKVAEMWFPSKMNNTFNKFGIFCHKPERRIVGIKKEFMSSYVLGIMDADGCFVVRHRKDCRSPRLGIHITSSANLLLEDLQRYVEENLYLSSSIYQRKETKCFEFRMHNTKHSIEFGKWIYSSAPNNYNYKKHKIFIDYYSNYCSGTNLGELLESA